MPILVEDAVKPDARPLVSLDEMKREAPDADWKNMECGQPITPELADRFDELAVMNRYKESHPYKGYTSKEANEENQRRRFRSDVGYYLFFIILAVVAIAFLISIF